MKRSISLSSIIGSQAALTRGLASAIKSKLDASDSEIEYALDMSGVNQMSRAFAHEFIVLLADLRSTGIQIELQQLTDEQKLIFDRIEQTFRKGRDSSATSSTPEISLEFADKLFSEKHI